MPAASEHGTARLYRILLVLMALALASRVTFTLDAIRDMRHQYPEAPVRLGNPWPSITALSDGARAAGLQMGDRVIAIDGRAQEGSRDFFTDLRHQSLGSTMQFLIERHSERRTVSVTIQPMEFGSGYMPIVFVSIEWILMPWLCFGIGFWVAGVRIRDARAWMLLGILLGLAEFTRIPVLSPLGWGDIGVEVQFYTSVAGPFWSVSMMLFGIYFPHRWRFDQAFPWVKWVLGAPLVGAALWSAAVGGVAAVHYTAAQSLMPRAPEVDGILTGVLTALALVTPCFFFIGISYKWRDKTLDPGDRRRLKLLYTGTTVAMTPLLLLVMYTAIRFHRVPGDEEDLFVALANLALLICPLTMAYVIMVQRAMDVRMVVRQGVQYALAKRGIVILQGVLITAVISISINAGGRHVSGFARAMAIALGVVVVIRLRPMGVRLRLWLDRKFFREAYNAEQILSELSEQVRSILDTRELLDTVMRRISDSLHVDHIAVLLREGGWYKPAYVSGYSGPADFALPADAPVVTQLRTSRAPVSLADNEEAKRMNAQLLLPLASKKDLLGFISLGPKKSGEPYSPSDTSLLRTVAAQTGMALENSRLTEAVASEMAQRELLSREIEIAREVQQRLFPQTMPEVPALQYAGHCRPARGVGGDYYDFLALTGGSLGLAIGDVSGKGIPAALLMASLQASVRGQSLSRGADVAGLMANVSRLVFDASESNRYATFFYGQFDPATRNLIYTNGGHNPPMVLRGAEVMMLDVGGPPVGLFREAAYEQAEVQLAVGDLLVFFTDGISEAENGASDEWGEAALIATVRACGNALPAEIITRIMQAADAFVSGAPQHDDMTLVVARVL